MLKGIVVLADAGTVKVLQIIKNAKRTNPILFINTSMHAVLTFLIESLFAISYFVFNEHYFLSLYIYYLYIL